MKRASLVLVLSFFVLSALTPQTMEGLNGTTIQEDLAMVNYPKDPQAEAVVIMDIGDASFVEDVNDNYIIRFKRRTRTRVFKPAGSAYSEISIPFYHTDDDVEELREISAVSYNMVNGTIVRNEIDKSSIYTEKLNNRWSVKKFVVPDVREGSVFEVSYTLESPFLFNLPDWEFQSSIPTIYSQYTTRMIPFFTYAYIIQGTNKLDLQNKEEGSAERTSRYIPTLPLEKKTFRDVVYTFGMKDLPAFRDDAFISSRKDYIVKLDMQLAKIYYPSGAAVDIMTTWPKLNEELLKDETLGGYIKKCSAPAESMLKDLGPELPADTLEKYQMLTGLVKKTFTWNGYYGKYASENPRDVFKRKTGSAAEINMFLIALLRAAGIEADPLILSTRNNGRINQSYPFESFFNYVIAAVKINGTVHLSDATEPFLAYNRIPPRCINEKGLLLTKKEPLWVNLPDNRVSTDYKDIVISPGSDPENCSAELKVKATDLTAYRYRIELKDDNKLFETELKQNGFSSITSFSTRDYSDPAKPYYFEATGTIETDRLGNQIGIYPFLRFPIRENPLKQTSRSYPVDMIFPESRSFRSVIYIPEGYRIAAQPQDYSLENSMVSINLKYETGEKEAVVTGQYAFKKAVYLPSEYPRLKLYIDNIVNQFNQQIILEKI